MTLAVVRSLETARSLRSVEELEDFEQELFGPSISISTATRYTATLGHPDLNGQPDNLST